MHGAVGELVEEDRRHLRPARVVHADEEHLRHTTLGGLLRLTQRLQPLAGKSLGEDDQETGHRRGGGEPLEGVHDALFDGLEAEDAGELTRQAPSGTLQLLAICGRHHGRSTSTPAGDAATSLSLQMLVVAPDISSPP